MTSPAEDCIALVRSRFDASVSSVDLSVIDETTICLEQIWSETERRKGHGTRAMETLVRSADEAGVSIRLHPSRLLYDLDSYEGEVLDRNAALNEQAMSDAALERWYDRFGFVATGAFDGDHPVMERSPAPSSTPSFG